MYVYLIAVTALKSRLSYAIVSVLLELDSLLSKPSSQLQPVMAVTIRCTVGWLVFVNSFIADL